MQTTTTVSASSTLAPPGRKCHKCGGSGEFRSYGKCYACAGKGRVDRTDAVRNVRYWKIRAQKARNITKEAGE